MISCEDSLERKTEQRSLAEVRYSLTRERRTLEEKEGKDFYCHDRNSTSLIYRGLNESLAQVGLKIKNKERKSKALDM